MNSKKSALIKYLKGVVMLSLIVCMYACNQNDNYELEEVSNEYQSILDSEKEDKIFGNPEQNPEFPGGYSALHKFLSDNVKYPSKAKKNRIEGKVYVSFVIDLDGRVTNVKVLRSVDPLLDKEAVRVIKKMPNWKPGKRYDKPQRASYIIPINFELQ